MKVEILHFCNCVLILDLIVKGLGNCRCIGGVGLDFEECLSDFSNCMYRGYYITRHDLEEDRGLDGEGDVTGYRFAQDIVEKYRCYYDVSF